MHHGAGRVGTLDRQLGRCERGFHPRIVDHERSTVFVSNQLRRVALQILLGDVRGLGHAPLDLH
jgi:hypothetical protein